MYFAISKNKNQFLNYIFHDSMQWEKIIGIIKGEILELFQNDKLEKADFENYFIQNYKNLK